MWGGTLGALLDAYKITSSGILRGFNEDLTPLSGTCAYSPAPCSVPGIHQKTPEWVPWRHHGKHYITCNIYEENRVAVVNLPVLPFSGECQLSCTALVYKHRYHWTISVPDTSLMELVSDSLVRNIHIRNPLEVMLWNLGCIPLISLHTKEQTTVLLVGSCISTLLPISQYHLHALQTAPGEPYYS